MLQLIQSVQAKETMEIGNLVINLSWWPYLFLSIKYFLILVTIFLVVGMILLLIRTEGGFKVRIREAMEEAMEAGRLPKTKVQREWGAIVNNLDSDNFEDNKKAVLDAEKLFDRVLKAANFSGSNIEERLSRIPDSQLEFKEDIIWAYKFKKRILQNDGLKIEREEIERAVYIFERALKEIGIL